MGRQIYGDNPPNRENYMTNDIDYSYGLLMEGRLDMIALPSGAVTWFWKYDRPDAQQTTATSFAIIAREAGDPVTDAALLRADQNVLVLYCQSGNKISVYPDGGLGTNGQTISTEPEGINAFLSGAVEPEIGAVIRLPSELSVEPVVDMMS